MRYVILNLILICQNVCLEDLQFVILIIYSEEPEKLVLAVDVARCFQKIILDF